ncbi:DNA polymerase-3 subunit epsilon [Fontibacillus phaseoli]|uniref:DNA polymerase-3 subunit epsilon n=1 Tax=Fontibacillus phaseoli TaxID=1416533 RepID=A0A369BMS8_9BACL|nr:3'-5' exonuclease [Fontibacillus phaseoli]RCX22909.1 DNA polymerase-3 subunit epsilon [Fontibacillus phaseoli]
MITPEIVTVIDIETTGLDPSTDHITEIAAIRAEIITDTPGLAYREIGRFQTFVALPPGVEIPEMITELTGIRAEDSHGAPNFYRAYNSLRHFAYGTTIIAHNAPFDLSFLDFPAISRGFVCTRALSRLVDPDESARLADCCARYGIVLRQHHRAMNDVEATLHLYAKLREKAEINGISYRNVVIDSEERPLKYVPPGAIVRKITKEAA